MSVSRRGFFGRLLGVAVAVKVAPELTESRSDAAFRAIEDVSGVVPFAQTSSATFDNSAFYWMTPEGIFKLDVNGTRRVDFPDAPDVWIKSLQ